MRFLSLTICLTRNADRLQLGISVTRQTLRVIGTATRQAGVVARYANTVQRTRQLRAIRREEPVRAIRRASAVQQVGTAIAHCSDTNKTE